MTEKIPRACLAWPSLIVATAKVLQGNPEWWGMSEASFLGAVMVASGGSVSPRMITDLRAVMMDEAGLSDD